MGMRSSDATFLQRDVLPILERASALSPEAAQAVVEVRERIQAAEKYREAPSVRLYLNSVDPSVHIGGIEVDGHRIPYIEITRGDDWPEGAVALCLDNRFGFDTTEDELLRWGSFLANAMAVSAGRTSHGEHSYIRNPHGRSGGGDPPVMIGDSMLEVLDKLKEK